MVICLSIVGDLDTAQLFETLRQDGCLPQRRMRKTMIKAGRQVTRPAVGQHGRIGRRGVAVIPENLRECGEQDVAVGADRPVEAVIGAPHADPVTRPVGRDLGPR